MGTLADASESENIRKVFGLCERVLDKRWSVSDVGIPYRWVNHWDREKLLLDGGREGARWRKFSFVDYAWIKIVTELRAFGLSFDVIRRVKDVLATRIPLSPDPSREVAGAPREGNVLLLLIAECVLTRAPLYLLIARSGECFFYNPGQRRAYGSELEDFLGRPHLSLSLTHLLGDFIRQNQIDFLLPEIPLVSPGEAQVVRLLREGRLRRLRLYPARGRSVDLEPGADAAEAERRFLEAVMRRGYRRIAYETAEGKRISLSRPGAAREGEVAI